MPSELRKFYDVTSRFGRHGWREDLPVNRKFVWFKATFDTPIGIDLVDLDFKGLGKGHVWSPAQMAALLHEFGGNPSFVTVQTLIVGRACANVYEGSTLELSCQGGKRASKISTASFGNPTGKECSHQQGTCKSLTTVAAVTMVCVGKPSCGIIVSEAFLGTSNCNDG
ncbi:hypothetical protein Ancab_009062 [Ancistrocladus abbreviatus]